MFRQTLAVLLTLTLSFTTVACGSSNNIQNPNTTNFSNNTSVPSNNISNGKYPVQQAIYNDADGEYTLMLLNTPPGSSPTFRSTNLQMARLTDEEINNGEKTYININGQETVMHLSEDFRIEYVHNVTETRTNPETGQPQTVVVRQQSSFWSPFAGALAGQALGSLLFTPQYYVPPAYQPGRVMTGYGGYGRTYNQAVSSYESTYKSSPAAVKNRNSFRATGSLKSNSNNSNSTTPKSNTSSTKATGSGFGSSNLETRGNNSNTRKRSSNSFGTKRSTTRTLRRTPTRNRSFGGSRRRR